MPSNDLAECKGTTLVISYHLAGCDRKRKGSKLVSLDGRPTESRYRISCHFSAIRTIWPRTTWWEIARNAGVLTGLHH